MSIAKMSMNDKVSLLKELYYEIAGKGQDGDTMLAHINPEEALLLKAHGGSGTINPNTGLPEYKKAVKTVVKVAAVAAAVYYGGPALMSAMAPSAAASVGTTAFWAGANTAGFAGLGATLGSGLTLSNAISGAGLLSSVAGNVQSQKYISKGTDAMREQTVQANNADEARNRYNQLLQKRSRLSSIRQARIGQGQIGGNMGILGQGGTSGFTGSIGSIGSQTSANLGNINVAEDVGNQITGFNVAAANAGSQANSAKAKAGMWSSVDTLGGTLLSQSDKIASIFGQT
tara:strand:- start:2324 stop:3184 length:861 start_codon:yes stop_codon:yes gene_type:complete